MTDVVTCPDPATLDRLLAGLAPEDRATELEEHLLGCARCCQAVRELLAASSEESVASAHAASELSEDPAVIEVANRVATLRLPDQRAANCETVVADADTMSDAWEVDQILDPPVSEGEIGRFGGFRVLRLLGTGGMGLVWEAEDPQLCRRVALKVMKPSLADRREHRARFLREAQAAAAIDHSHIVTVYQVGEHRGLPFLAMQLLRGETLDDALSRAGRLPQAECLRIGRQMAEGLAAAHRRGLIHRDIKPTNTWLEADGGWVKLVDFGLVQVIADKGHLTQTGLILGTPAYMSPEQARGDTVDPRSDLFSLGAVLYHMATGVGPFQGASTLAVLTSLALRVPEPPRGINPEISPGFSDLILRLLAKDPVDRLPSADAVVEQIRQLETNASSKAAPTLRGGQPVATSDRPSSVSRSAGAGFRSPRWLLLAAAGAVLLAAIIIVIRNRHGEKVGELHLSDGHQAEILQTHVAVAAPNAIVEPPELEEWLRGRTILTVSQDGTGQFKTIQTALDACRPGQAVEVLDRGPYRETLLVAGLRDVGLFSRAGTVIEPGGKRRAYEEGDTADFHRFSGTDRFRLSGLSFVSDDLRQIDPGRWWIDIAMSSDVLVEHCRFAGGGRFGMHELFIGWYPEIPGTICHIRECLFEMAPHLTIFEGSSRAVAIIERNWFRTTPPETSLTIDGAAERVVVRHNIFDSEQERALRLWKTDGTSRLEIYNNTMMGPILVQEKPSETGVIVRNNLFCQGIAIDGEGDLAALEAAVKSWQVGNNEYAEPGRADPFPQTASDFAGKPTFLSRDSTDANYLRIASNSPEAQRGTGGAWPGYLGALPPGPPPADGDWFTHWVKAGPVNIAPKPRPFVPSPSTGAALSLSEAPEPPPLDEWLKD
ncbi:MAG TPA: protein kinase [Pirellulales bacterium]|nr:protein kinase [Pirellulales bacterium]